MRPERAKVIPLTVRGSQTSVYAYGPEDGPLILAVHGFRGTHYGLEPLAFVLAASGYRVLVPDLPGAGRSTPLDGPHDASGYGRWLSDLVHEFPGRSMLLGHSFGSVIVASAIARGITYDRAVLINPILEPPLTGPRGLATIAARAYYALAERLPNRLGHRLLASRLIAGFGGTLMTSTRDRALRRWIREEHFRQADAFASRDVVLQSFAASTSTTVSDFSNYLTAPTLILGADRDPLSPSSACSRDATGIRSGTFHIFAKRGHLLPYEETHRVAELIAAWDASVINRPSSA